MCVYICVYVCLCMHTYTSRCMCRQKRLCGSPGFQRSSSTPLKQKKNYLIHPHTYTYIYTYIRMHIFGDATHISKDPMLSSDICTN